MSNRDSMGFGDLLPQDVVQIFAHEKHGKRGSKKRSHSLGRALGWLKGKKRKGFGSTGQNLGLGPALDLALDGHTAGHKGGSKSGRQTHLHGNSQALPKRDNDDRTPAPLQLQENVFIEASRPKYLEDLHTEALEGLKMMQEEETNNGVEFRDNESTISTMSVHTDGEGGGFTTDSTIADTSSVVSMQSSVSTKSARSGLTRQASTFTPLNSGKKSEKTKRRRHRKTVAGIPQHVQRELGLDRVGWTVTQRLDEEQFYNGETDDSTADWPQQAQRGASASLQGRKVIQPRNRNQVGQVAATHAGHRDDLALLHRLGPDFSGGERPRSLAVPWMTTADSVQQEPPSPVITMSPQAAYMSKIIPNAVLPPSIEVVEISRGRSRNSLRTVSKSSLLLSSPAPSRASSRASSSRTTSSRSSNISSASRHALPNMSDSSCWSNSESSETLVSDSTTISRSSTPRQKSQDGDASAKEDKVSVHSVISKASRSNGMLTVKGDAVKKEGQFVRSLSIMKSKKAPPPPSRSYSLHSKMKRRSRDLAEVRIPSGESSLHRAPRLGEENEKSPSSSSPSRIIDSPGYNADTSSLDESTGSATFSLIKSQALMTLGGVKGVEKVSPQQKKEPLPENKLNKIISPSSGYSSQDATSPLSKQPHGSSPKQKKGILAKLQKFFPGSTSSAPSPLELPGLPENTDSVDTVAVTASVRALRELFNIPPPPKVHAPPPPPPEVWAHSKRSVELLLGPPAPDNVYAIIKKNPKDRRQQRQSPSVSTEESVKSSVVERKHKNPAVTAESTNGSLHVLERKQLQESVNAGIQKENNERLAQDVDLKGNGKVTGIGEKGSASDILNRMLEKAVVRRGDRQGPAGIREEEAKTTTTEGKTTVDTLPSISLVRISSSTSSPLVSHHPPVAHKNTEVASGTSVQAAVSPESSWPPPPPPMSQVVIGGPDEMDCALPPPPSFREVGGVPVVAVVTTGCIKVTKEAEPQGSSSSQGAAPAPLSIPPPPSYTAPPPPNTAVSPSAIKTVSPTPIEIIPPPPHQPPPPKEFSPPPKPKEFCPPPPPVFPPPPSKEVSPPAPKEFLLPPPEFSPPSPKELSPPLKPKEFSPPPPPVFPPPPSKEVSPPATKEVLLPPPEFSPPSPKELSPPPQPKDVSPPPPKRFPRPPEFSPPPQKEFSAPPPQGACNEVSSVRDKQSSPTLVQDVPPPLVIKVSPLPPQEIPAPPTEKVSILSSQENATQSPVEDVLVSKLSPPQSIPPPPPLPPQLSEQDIDLPHEIIPSESKTNPVSSDSILTPPQSVPPPPQIQLVNQPQVVPTTTDEPITHEVSESPPFEIPVPQAPETCPLSEKIQEPAPSPVANRPLPVQVTEIQSQEMAPDGVVHEEPITIVTPSLLQMVKLRSVNSSPEPPKAQERAQAEVTLRKRQQNNPVPTSSGETPQKPIRKSLIITSPTSTSPPVTINSQPALPKSQSLVAPPASSSTVPSPTKKSPPAMVASPSMNLQEAIRLRTAARSKESPASRLSLHSPTSPKDLHKSPRSPSSTASFIFSKSNKRVVMETKPASEVNTSVHKLEVSSVPKVASEAVSLKKASKVPPPVAKKPKSTAKENECSEERAQTAGQEAQQESIHDAAEKTNGTSSTPEGGEIAST